jgi:3D (Asp-Asp-Asp) domain-containing protein
MTRINLLVAKVVLLGVCILCISSVSVWAEGIKISVTAYTLKECYHNKGKTASGEIVRTGVVAVSPDLERKGLKLGTKIKIDDLGTFIVKDRTSRRNRGNVDIYMTSYKKALQFGRQKHTLVLNQEPEDFLKGFYNSLFIQFDFNSEFNMNEINAVRRSISLLGKEKFVCTLD